MNKLNTLQMEQKIVCECGNVHIMETECIFTEFEAALRLSSFVKEKQFKKILIVCDINTLTVAGEQIARQCEKSDIPHYLFIFPCKETLPDEESLGRLLISVEEETDCVIAVGSGTINDLVRYCSFRLRIPYCIISTAASMDGYLSSVSPLIVDSIKTTYEAHGPIAVFNDYNILMTAPKIMTAAGAGDIMGKLFSLTDWKLSNMLFDEYYCGRIEKITNDAIKICSENAVNGNTNLVKSVIDALMFSGKAMCYMGNSRPASGAEHHISHFWEMRFLLEGKKTVLHGVKVAVASITILKLCNMLLEETPDFDKAEIACEEFSFEQYKEEIIAIYGKAAYSVIETESRSKRSFPSNTKRRINIYRENWAHIIKILHDHLPSEEEITNILKVYECPVSPIEIGVDKKTYIDGICYAKELRDRFTVLQIIADLGLLRQYALKLASYYF